MSGLMLEVLPFALGAAVSPTLLTLELLILTGRTNPKARAWMFVIGAGVTIFVFGFVAATILRNVGSPASDSVDPWTVALKVVIALVLALLGFRQLRPPKTAAEKHHGSVQERLATAKTPFFIGVGVLGMLTDFSTLVLYLPAVHIIVHSDADSAQRWAAAAMLWVITMIPILLPVLAVTIVGRRSDALLARINGWTTSHARQINAGLCFLFAVLVGYSAVKELMA